MNARSDELRIYFARVRPIFAELFNTAYAICGNYDEAEYALRRTIYGGWLRESRVRSKLGFREGLRADIKRTACSIALSAHVDKPEYTWDAMQDRGDDDEEAGLRVIRAVFAEDNAVRRMLVLKYGCGFRDERIAKLTDESAGQVHMLINRFEAKLRRRLSGADRRRMDALLREEIRRELALDTRQVPDAGAAYRSFEVEALQSETSGKYIGKGLRAALFALICVLLAGLFWLISVVSQPPMIKEDAPVSAVQTPAPVVSQQAVPQIEPASQAATAAPWPESETP